MFRPEDGRPTNSQFAVRIAILSGIALVAFAVIFFRLWYLEVLSSEAYLDQSQNNRVREVTVQAPRGEILDRNGRTLVGNRTALALQIQPEDLPTQPRVRDEMFKELSKRADIPVIRIEREIRRQTKDLPANPVTLEQDVDRNLVYWLRERQDIFRGVSVEEIFVREYPEGDLAAHLWGYVNEVNAKQLEQPQFEALAPGDRVGAAGLELQYDAVLRGTNGAKRVQVDALGNPQGRALSEVPPETGNDLVTTLDLDIQEAGEQGLARFGKPGAFVALDVNDGSVLGMGSFPSFDPEVFTPPVAPSAYNALFEDEDKPLANRAAQGQYPTGSSFKPITALAALSEGALTTNEIIVDDGVYEIDVLELKNAGDAVYGPIALRDALKVSSDVYFYTLGERADTQTDEGIQTWARRLGLGPATGLDLPYEAGGLIPTPEWRNELYAQAADPDSCGGRERLFEEGCYETDRPWTAGDNVNLAIGQGDLVATPLQMAVAYAAIGNANGDVVRPHLGRAVEDPLGRPVEEVDPAPRRSVEIEPAYRQVILDGLRDAAMTPNGTSYEVFGRFPIEIAGKTGTVERDGQLDQSWYVAMSPYPSPDIVVAATVEGGGFGSDTAAPIVRDILAAANNIDPAGIEEPTDGGSEVAE